MTCPLAKPKHAVAVEPLPRGELICGGTVEGRPLAWKEDRPGACVRRRQQSKNYREWKRAVAKAVRAFMDGRKPYPHPAFIEAVFFVRPAANPVDNPDWDNLMKGFQDCLKRIVFPDDGVVQGGTGIRSFTSVEAERVEFKVTAA